MLVKDMIARLEKFDPELEMTVLDGFNGGGQSRTINFGPRIFDPADKEHTFDGDENQNYEDVETAPGQKIVMMGYGFY